MSRKRKQTKSTPKKFLDVVVTTGGRFDLLKLCLESLEKQTVQELCNVIVIDNASDPEERIANSDIFLSSVIDMQKRLTQGVGFPALANEGARMGKAGFILFLSDDVKLPPDAIEKMLERMKDPTIGVLGIKLLFPEDSTSNIRPAGKVQHVGLAMNIRGDVIHPLVAWDSKHSKTCISREVFAVTGACFLTRRSIFKKANGFFEGYGLGCVTGDTLVITEQGMLSMFEILDNLDAPFMDTSMDMYLDSLEGKARTGVFHKNDVSNVKRMVMSHGFEIKATPNHKFIVMQPNGVYEWKELQKIKVGDYVALKHGSDMWGSKTMDSDDAYLLGLYVAEGSCETAGNTGRITITNGDKEIQTFLLDKGFHKSQRYHFRKGTIDFFEHMISLGMNPNEKAKNKTIPQRIRMSNKYVVISFLQGLFDGDGCAIRDGRVTYTSSSLKLIKELQMLLLNFGILSSISKKLHKGILGYTLDMGGFSSEFYTQIGFRLQRKQSRSALVRKKLSKILPFQREWYKRLYLYEDIGHREHRLLGMHCTGKYENVRLDGVNLLLYHRERFKNTTAYRHLKRVAGLQVFWLKVKSIKDVIDKVETFDLHVPGFHNYIANGLVSHNTYEDVDFCLQARSQGYIVFVDTDIIGYHYVGATVEKKQVPFPLQQNAMMFKARWQSTGAFVWDDYKFF